MCQFCNAIRSADPFDGASADESFSAYWLKPLTRHPLPVYLYTLFYCAGNAKCRRAMPLFAACQRLYNHTGGKLNMKAVLLEGFGGVEVLKVGEAPRPVPKENEVLVRVMA